MKIITFLSIGPLAKSITLLYRVTLHRGLLHALDVLFTTVMEKLPVSFSHRISARKRELMYWEKQIIGLGDFSHCMTLRLNRDSHRQLFPDELLPFFKKLQSDIKDGHKLAVLDVGSGPVSLLSWGKQSGLFELCNAEPLADSYKELFYSYGYTSLIDSFKTIQCSCEDLDSHCTSESFDVIYCNNALDHTNPPKRSLEKMITVVRQGGYIIISGRSHEGTHEGWDCMHRHDLYIKDNTLWRSGKNETSTPLAKNLPLVTIESKAGEGFHGKMMIIFRKT